jgi:hypothetical protein
MSSDDENFFDSDKDDTEPINEPLINVPDKPTIVAEFCDGYSLRNLIEYLKGANTSGDFKFSAKRIEYYKSDNDGAILNKAVIFTSELTNYVYNSPDKETIVSVSLAQLRSITKSIGKKDSVRLYMLHGENILYIQIINHTQKFTSGNGGANIVRLQPEGKLDEYVIDDVFNPENFPNYRIPTLHFSKICIAMQSNRSNYVYIHGFPSGVLFEGMQDGDIITRVDPYGDVDPKSEISRTSIRINVIKNLAKFNNLSPNGIVKIYFSPEGLIQLICNIGTYGRIRVYLKEPAPKFVYSQ